MEDTFEAEDSLTPVDQFVIEEEELVEEGEDGAGRRGKGHDRIFSLNSLNEEGKNAPNVVNGTESAQFMLMRK